MNVNCSNAPREMLHANDKMKMIEHKKSAVYMVDPHKRTQIALSVYSFHAQSFFIIQNAFIWACDAMRSYMWIRLETVLKSVAWIE